MALESTNPNPSDIMDEESVAFVINRLRCQIFGSVVWLAIRRDQKVRPRSRGRLYIQAYYREQCIITGEEKEFSGRKWYLSDHMTEDEVVKTCYAAFRACVEHEVMEGFTFCGERVFNPHADFRALIAAGKKQVFRA